MAIAPVTLADLADLLRRVSSIEARLDAIEKELRGRRYEEFNLKSAKLEMVSAKIPLQVDPPAVDDPHKLD